MVEYRVDRTRQDYPDYYGTAFFGCSFNSDESAESIFGQITRMTLGAFNESERVKKDPRDAALIGEMHPQKITVLASFDVT